MSLLAQIAIFLAAAVIAIPIFRFFRLGSVLGYLAAGIVIGPACLGLISKVDATEHIAEFGIVLLMFVIGLELQPSRLWVMRKSILGLGLAQVLASTHAYTVVHCCAASVPFGIIRAAGADGVAFDLSQLRRGEEDEVAEAAEAGMGMFTGAAATVPGPGAGGAGAGTPGPAGSGRAGGSNPADGSSEARETAERVLRLWQRVGLPPATAADQAVITPACGLAGASPAQARAALTRCREAAAMLPELIEETRGSQHE